MAQRDRGTSSPKRGTGLILAHLRNTAGPWVGTLPAVTDINSAPVERLRSLSGVGVLYAKKIVEGRPYRTTDELVSKMVLPPSTYNRLKDQIAVGRR